MDDSLILNKLNEIINVGINAANEVQRSNVQYVNPRGTSFSTFESKNGPQLNLSGINGCLVNVCKFQRSAENILRVRFGEKSIYYQDFLNTYDVSTKNIEFPVNFYCRQLASQIGVLQAVKFAIENKLTEDLFYQRELLVFSDLLEQAFEFLEYELLLAAAMYGRVVLESTVKEFAEKNGIVTNKKFDQIIIELRKNELIHKPLEDSLRANYGIGNWAAHGDEKFKDLSKKQIEEFLTFIRDKVLTLQ